MCKLGIINGWDHSNFHSFIFKVASIKHSCFNADFCLRNLYFISEAIAATEGMIEHRRMGGGHIVEQRQRDASYELRRSIQQVPLHEHPVASSQQFSSTFFANRKLFAAIESLTRTLNTDHSRQFHQEMLKTAVELSNSYATQQRQQYAAATVSSRRNATVERRNVSTAPMQHSDYEDVEKSFGKVMGRRQVEAAPLRSWAFRKGSKFE